MGSALLILLMLAVLMIIMIRSAKLKRKGSNSKYCHKCGTQLSGGNYCSNCGTKVGSAPNSQGKRVLFIFSCLIIFMIVITAIYMVIKAIDANETNDENGSTNDKNSSVCGEKTEQVIYCDDNNLGIEYESKVYQYENINNYYDTMLIK